MKDNMLSYTYIYIVDLSAHYNFHIKIHNKKVHHSLVFIYVYSRILQHAKDRGDFFFIGGVGMHFFRWTF